ncbi:MAG: hypothetical protein JRN54_02360 [Nitrososphaerota archaeon]|jgi:anti-sigma-K factor RskA|nr:hypothetical protein [Nitrososphaerota archaeon]MDG7016023.1 hypothetical protein [Nitrososphaerota archaeon]
MNETHPAERKSPWVVAIVAVVAAILALSFAAYVIQNQQTSTPIIILLPQPETLSFAPMSSSLGSATFSMVQIQGSTMTFMDGNGHQVAKVQGSGTPLTISIAKGAQNLTVTPASLPTIPTGSVTITYFGPFSVTTPAATVQFHSGNLFVLLNANGTVSTSYKVS